MDHVGLGTGGGYMVRAQGRSGQVGQPVLGVTKIPESTGEMDVQDASRNARGFLGFLETSYEL